LDEKRYEIVARREGTKPLVDEYRRLDAAAAALEALPGSMHATPATRRSHARTGGQALRNPTGSLADPDHL
jgi:hypothetical protein